MADFGRIITAMVTPFDDSLAIDMGRLEKLVNYLIEEQKSDSLVVCGTTGESPTLSDDEKGRLLEAVIRFAKGRCKIIAGTGSYDTAHTIHLTKLAEKAGADGILLVAPYYNRPSQEGLYQHFKAAAEATGLPVMLYNIPGRTGIHVSPEVTLRLARELPNVAATKEAHSDLDQISILVRGAPDHFRVYSGDDSNTLPFLSIGAYGVVSVSSHIVGSEMQKMVAAFLEGRTQDAQAIHLKLHPIFKGMFECPHRVPNPAPVKHALSLKQVPVGGLRLPLVPVTEEEGRFIAALLQDE